MNHKKNVLVFECGCKFEIGIEKYIPANQYIIYVQDDGAAVRLCKKHKEIEIKRFDDDIERDNRIGRRELERKKKYERSVIEAMK